MSALNDTLTYREVQHEWDLHSRQWETEHMEDDDIMRLRAETSRMPSPRPARTALGQPMWSGTLHDRARARLENDDLWNDYGYDDCDQEEER